jgi:hypothetical protein
VNAVAVAGRYAYVGLNTVSGNEFRIFDISNPTSPSTAGGVELDSDSVLSVAIAGKYAYIGLNNTSGTNAFRIIDVSNATAPITVGASKFFRSRLVPVGKDLTAMLSGYARRAEFGQPCLGHRIPPSFGNWDGYAVRKDRSSRNGIRSAGGSVFVIHFVLVGRGLVNPL